MKKSVKLFAMNSQINDIFTGIKGVIFDYGGTIDSAGDHWSEVIWNAWQKADIAVSKGEFREAYVFAERELARVRHILPQHTFADMLLIKMRLELQWLSENGLFPPALVEEKAKETADLCYKAAEAHVKDAIPVLKTLAEKFPLVLVSNFYGNIESVLKDFGIYRFFKKIIESAVVGVRKPDPEIFRLGVKALGMDPKEVLVVGDSIKKDILPATSIGCHAVWIKGLTWDPAEESTPPAGVPTIDSLSELISK